MTDALRIRQAFEEYVGLLERGEASDPKTFVTTLAPGLRDEVERLLEAHLSARSADADKSPDALEAGDVVGDFRLIRELGRGGMGVVWEADQQSLNRRVALKILNGRDASPEALERFRREAEAAGRLNHDGIVAVHGFAQWGPHGLLVQELVSGDDLGKVLEDRHWNDAVTDEESCEWAAKLCATLADALQHAHEHDVIHRDVKPANVLLDEEGRPKLADFGLARLEDKEGLSRTGVVMGTPHYMSPEQVAGGRGGLDARTDVYSLGVVLYHMLAKRVPFPAKDLKRAFADILTRAPKPLHAIVPHVDRDLEAVCLKALEKAPDERYRTAGEFAEDLRRYLRGESTTARPVSGISLMNRRLRHLASLSLGLSVALAASVWSVVDLIVLQPLAAQDPALHAVRIGAAALALVAVGWPLSILSQRVARGARAAGWLTWLVLAALGAVFALQVWSTRLDQLLAGARVAFADVLTTSDRRDVDDIDAFIDAWEPRFGDQDLFLVTRAYLRRKRPTLAEPWVARLESVAGAGPAVLALSSAVHEALGQDDLARSADAALWSGTSEGSPWTAWALVGDVLMESGRAADALTAYRRAGTLPGADRDRLNLQLARVYGSLCEWAAARDALDDYLKWSADDWTAHQLAVRLAVQAGDAAAAERHLERLEAHPRVPPDVRIATRYDALAALGRATEAGAYFREMLDAHADDPEVVGWCAWRTYLQGESARGAGDGDAAREHYQDALRLYVRLGNMSAAGSVVGLVGQAASDIRLAVLLPEQARQRYADAVAAARRAVEVGPSYFDAHFNLGEAVKEQAKHLHGSASATALSVEEMHAYTEHFFAAVERNGMQPRILNNTAWACGRLFELTGDAAILERGLALGRRAVRLASPERAGGACAWTPNDGYFLAHYYSTLAGLQEQAGDVSAALASVEAGQASYALPRFTEDLERLRKKTDG